MKSIGEIVRELRHAQGMTLESMSMAIDSDTGNLSRFERGVQDVSDEKLQRISELYRKAESDDSTAITSNDLAPKERLFIRSVEQIITENIVPSHVLQTVLLLLESTSLPRIKTVQSSVAN